MVQPNIPNSLNRCFPELRKFIMQSAEKKWKGHKNSIWTQTFEHVTYYHQHHWLLTFSLYLQVVPPNNHIHEKYLNELFPTFTETFKSDKCNFKKRETWYSCRKFISSLWFLSGNESVSSLVALEWARKSTGSGGRLDSVFCCMTVNKLVYPLTLNFFKFEWFKK